MPIRMNSNNVFSALTARYPTTEALFAYLRSPEGGRLLVRQSKESPLALIYYDKAVSNLSIPHVGAFRSIVWDERTNRPIGVSPAKGRHLDDLSGSGMGLASVEDFVDGIMINQFWDGERWRLFTRTILDAGLAFYGTYRGGDGPTDSHENQASNGDKSFAALFHDTMMWQLGVTVANFPKNFCYSWVLNHPAERVVVPAKYGIPSLTLVELYSVDSATANVQTYTGRYYVEHIAASRLDDEVGMALAKQLEKALPAQHTDISTVLDIKARTAAWGRRFRHEWQGIVARCPLSGARFRIRSAEYEAARELRGNQSNLRYLWLEQWAKGKLTTYLTIYPEEAVEAEAVIAAFKSATEEVYQLYQRVYRRKELPLGQDPHKYRKLLWEVHAANSGAYFPALRSFMNCQDTARKLWLVNYERRYGSDAAAAAAASSITDTPVAHPPTPADTDTDTNNTRTEVDAAPVTVQTIDIN